MTTLVFVPGLLSDKRVWEPVAAAVPSTFAVHHADVSGFDALTAMAHSLLDQTTGPIVPVGHSMGGRVCMEMARLSPERVVGLVLADTGFDALRDNERAKRDAVVRLGYESMEALVDKWLPPMVSPARHSDSVLMNDLRQMALLFDADTHASWIKALVARPDAAEYMGSIRCPVLLLTGDEDSWSPVAQHEAMLQMFPDAEFSSIANAGHFAPLERPEPVAKVVREWLLQKVRPV